jgi:hypothetical protein
MTSYSWTHLRFCFSQTPPPSLRIRTAHYSSVDIGRRKRIRWLQPCRRWRESPRPCSGRSSRWSRVPTRMPMPGTARTTEASSLLPAYNQIPCRQGGAGTAVRRGRRPIVEPTARMSRSRGEVSCARRSRRCRFIARASPRRSRVAAPRSRHQCRAGRLRQVSEERDLDRPWRWQLPLAASDHGEPSSCPRTRGRGGVGISPGGRRRSSAAAASPSGSWLERDPADFDAHRPPVDRPSRPEPEVPPQV